MLRHIGFIMDGNGRWAQSKGLPRSDGYAYGLIALRKVAMRCQEKGIEAITVYAFSTENWARPSSEIDAISKVVEKFNKTYDGNLKITFMGDIYALDDDFIRSVEEIEEKTSSNDGMIMNIAYNYGGMDDIIHAAEVCYNHGEFTKDEFRQNLSSSHLPPLDLIVRTGGEKRLSNFMLFEAAYSELMFIDKMWPEMDEEDVDKIIDDFNSRQRKFGK